MNQFYYDAVTKMEQLGVDDEYVQDGSAASCRTRSAKSSV
jgi:hypothetical protein